MHKRLLRSLAKAHRRLHSNREILLTRIARLEVIASRHAGRNNPEAVEILDRLWLLRKQVEK